MCAVVRCIVLQNVRLRTCATITLSLWLRTCATIMTTLWLHSGAVPFSPDRRRADVARDAGWLTYNGRTRTHGTHWVWRHVYPVDNQFLRRLRVLRSCVTLCNQPRLRLQLLRRRRRPRRTTPACTSRRSPFTSHRGACRRVVTSLPSGYGWPRESGRPGEQRHGRFWGPIFGRRAVNGVQTRCTGAPQLVRPVRPHRLRPKTMQPSVFNRILRSKWGACFFENVSFFPVFASF